MIQLQRFDSRTTAMDALCVELPAEAPDWVHLLPLGPDVRGQDGRRWTLPDPEAVVRASLAALPAPIDYMHASEFTRPDGTGTEAPAAAWIGELRVVRSAEPGRPRPGIWGRVQWTPRGEQAVRNREYRFLSPAFRFSPATGAIQRITSAGLVHKPNLRELHALNGSGEPRELTELERDLCSRNGVSVGQFLVDLPAMGMPTALTDEQRATCAHLGVGEDAFLCAAQEEWIRERMGR